MKRPGTLSYLLLCLGMLTTRAGQSQEKVVTPPQRMGIVIVVDGSGESSAVAENLAKIVCERGLPLAVVPIRWCRWGLVAQDHKDYEAQMQAARKLAAYVVSYRAAHPGEKIYVIGQSSGTHVILAATCLLPAGSVDRIIVMASTVSYTYDLRPALLCSRGGVDALYSPDDLIVVLASDNCGTADRKQVQCAGEMGFAVPSPRHPDAILYKNLRQYRWDSSLAWTGHTGGHTGFTRKSFLEAYVLPMMLAPEIAMKR